LQFGIRGYDYSDVAVLSQANTPRVLSTHYVNSYRQLGMLVTAVMMPGQELFISRPNSYRPKFASILCFRYGTDGKKTLQKFKRGRWRALVEAQRVPDLDVSWSADADSRRDFLNAQGRL